jgi:hypothetical protein
MTEIIDRARLAVVEVIQSSDLPAGTYIDSEKIVRARLEAIREPTVEMCREAAFDDWGPDACRTSWRAMVDIALGLPRSP